MKRPDPAGLNEVTAIAKLWRRRCCGLPADGILTSGSALRVVLAASTNVGVYSNGTITWSGGGREFTAEPVLDES